MLLSILIPTYNRAKFLLRNLGILDKILLENEFAHRVEIIISNNCSVDDTNQLVTAFREKERKYSIKYYSQEENIGLENNVLFVLEKASGEYVMFLGDDDYVSKEYVDCVLMHIENSKTTFGIIPSYYMIDLTGKRLKGGRDTELSNKLYLAGFTNCYENSWRGHQISGLVLKRRGLLKSYLENKVSNIYPFIYFVSISALNGNIYHLTSFPVEVTQPGQENKDWTYGDDGLLNEVFNNYKKLPINNLKKTLLQIKMVSIQPWRLIMYRRSLGLLSYTKAFRSILFSSNSTKLFKSLFPLVVLYIEIINLVKKLTKR